MKQCHWIDYIHNNISLPVKIDRDNQYYESLKKLYNSLINGLKKNDAPEQIIRISEKYAKEVLMSIQEYYKGNIINAHSVIQTLFDDCCNRNEYAVSDINSSIAFPKVINPEKSEVQFFRARLSDNIVEYPADQMAHIPFENRSIVKSERFSIPGLPCLYLGNTSYVCWMEMGCPADHRFNVSPVLLDNTQKIFNLTIYSQLFYNVFDSDYSPEEIERKLSCLIKIYLFSIATSFSVKETNRNFKSEYIISQMLMLACKSKGYNGISYYSKQIYNDAFSIISGVNLVLFAEYDGNDGLSNICQHCKIGDSFNYSMFKQLMASLKYKKYSLRIDAHVFPNCIGSFKRQFPYRETEFYDFDNYLFANWEPAERMFINT